MKAVLFGTALLACTIPAFGQGETTLQPAAPAMTGSCEAAFFGPGVPSGVVVLTVPRLAHARGSLDTAQSLETQPSMAAAPPGAFTRPSSRPGGVIFGAGTTSGIGRIERSGVGSVGTSGVGSMEASGIGSIGMGGIGSIPASGPGLAQRPPSSPSPFTAPPPSPAAGSASVKENADAHPLPVTLRQVPFICP